jgi:hypothetical protein
MVRPSISKAVAQLHIPHLKKGLDASLSPAERRSVVFGWPSTPFPPLGAVALDGSVTCAGAQDEPALSVIRPSAAVT